MSEDDTRWRPVMYDFCQNSTVHGLRQITEPTPFKLRRVIWVLILGLGIALFLMQTIMSIMYYCSWPVSVNVKINYNDTLTFPTITLCNQNVFRATAAARAGRYDLIDHIYTGNPGENNFTDYQTRQLAQLNRKDLILQLGHQRKDMIVSCSWHKQQCHEDDFVLTLTDHGLCFSFNSGQKRPPRYTTETGAEDGLSLRLNLEQYDYMRGPNPAAGLKILVHDQNDVPLIRAMGQAVPPGSHAFVGIQIFAIRNLKPPHGKCDDSQQLEYFEGYTMATCLLDCKERYIVERCSCREYYMPTKLDTPDWPPVCTVLEYTECAVPADEAFNREKDKCKCPEPCERMLFDPAISYAASSNFDMDEMLQGNTSTLQHNFIVARETRQRVNPVIAASDRDLYLRYNRIVHHISLLLNAISLSLHEVMTRVDEKITKIGKRVDFHINRALHGITYTIEKDFIRGWEVKEERTLSLVTHAYIEFANSLITLLETSSSMEPDMLRVRWAIFEQLAEQKIDLCSRAMENITQVHDAFTTGTVLLNFKYTLDKYFDQSFVEPILPALKPIEGGWEKEESLMKNFRKGGIGRMVDGLTLMLEEGRNLVLNRTGNHTVVMEAINTYKAGCRSFNYYMFQYKGYVVERPLTEWNKNVEQFAEYNRTMVDNYRDINMTVSAIHASIENLEENIWNNVENVTFALTEYLNDTNSRKTDLADMFLSKSTGEMTTGVRNFFTMLRARALSLRDIWTKMSVAYTRTYQQMMGEPYTQPFYLQLNQAMKDFLAAANGTEDHEFYIKHWRYLLRINWKAVRKIPDEDFPRLLNADFPDTNWLSESIKIFLFFNNMRNLSDITGFLGTVDDEYMLVSSEVEQSLKKFKEGHALDFEFFRENFLRLDVFMRELRYEEIEQLIAYDMTNLWSDLGGNIGLFIGASALSVFEFIDVFIHNLCRKYVASRKKHKTGAPPHNSLNKSNDKNNTLFLTETDKDKTFPSSHI